MVFYPKISFWDEINKELDFMKRIFVIVAVCIIFVASICIERKNTVSERIISDIEENRDDVVTINLSDYTNFKWDSVILYDWPISSASISRGTGVDYDRDLDVSCGMIFVYENKVVYEEQFALEVSSPERFGVRPYNSLVRGYRMWKKEDAEFYVRVSCYDESWRNTYVMYAVDDIR